MPSNGSNAGFHSVVSAFMDQFLQEKRACGYGYHEPARMLHRLDDCLVEEGLETLELPPSLARRWLAKKAHESTSTQQRRITLVRQFSRFLLQAGCPAYVPDSTLAARKTTFVPRLLTDEELRKFFRAVDALEPTARSPLRHLIMPEVFRLLYGCGFRVSEVLKLRVRDVDLNQGIITGKVSQRSVGSPRLIAGESITQVCRPFRKPASRCDLLSGTQRRAFCLTHRLHTLS